MSNQQTSDLQGVGGVVAVRDDTSLKIRHDDRVPLSCYNSFYVKRMPYVFEGQVREGNRGRSSFHDYDDFPLNLGIEELKSWLSAHAGSFHFERIGYDGVFTFFNIYIELPTTATLFKLTWCGL